MTPNIGMIDASREAVVQILKPPDEYLLYTKTRN
jgi:hypothetical protein